MNCYFCEKAAPPGGIRYTHTAAIGVCRQCGAAVCAGHSHKATPPGSALLCLDCAAIKETPAMAQVSQPLLE
jgi:hypothetical protein